MGVTRSDIFTLDQNSMAQVAKVLGHPARIAILEHLAKVDKCICGDLVDTIGLAQPTISQHLKEIKNIGLIKGNIEGTSVCYCIDKDTLSSIASSFTALFSSLCRDEDLCC